MPLFILVKKIGYTLKNLTWTIMVNIHCQPSWHFSFLGNGSKCSRSVCCLYLWGEKHMLLDVLPHGLCQAASSMQIVFSIWRQTLRFTTFASAFFDKIIVTYGSVARALVSHYELVSHSASESKLTDCGKTYFSKWENRQSEPQS